MRLPLPEPTSTHKPAAVPYKRIATEEAFAPPEMLAIYRRLFERHDVDASFQGLMGFYMSSHSQRAQHIMRCLTDVGQQRLQHMDEAGITMQVLALTSPGVQVMDSATAVSFARTANDYLADAIARHPTRFAGMLLPFQEAGLDGAIYGFGVETGLHALRIITAGVFDRFPKLRMIIGHMGEALPFWAYRLDCMHRATVLSKRYASMQPLQKRPSDYLRENFYITNGGVAWPAAVKFTQDFMGTERALYAMDYPYQHAVDEVNFLDDMALSQEDKKRFFQTNAQTLFKIAA